MIRQLGKFGTIEITPPKSLAISFEIISVWSSNPDQATLGRLCASAIGICTESKPFLPSYRPERDKILDYGFRCLERLLEKGITASQIYNVGLECLMLCSDKLPNEEEITDIENFSSSRDSDI